MTELSDGSVRSIPICRHFEEPHRVIETLEGDRPAVPEHERCPDTEFSDCARHGELTGGGITTNTGGEVDRGTPVGDFGKALFLRRHWLPEPRLHIFLSAEADERLNRTQFVLDPCEPGAMSRCPPR